MCTHVQYIGTCVCVHMCTHACGGQGSTSSVSLNACPPKFLSHGLSLNLKLADLARLVAGKHADSPDLPNSRVSDKYTILHFLMWALEI